MNWKTIRPNLQLIDSKLDELISILLYIQRLLPSDSWIRSYPQRNKEEDRRYLEGPPSCLEENNLLLLFNPVIDSCLLSVENSGSGHTIVLLLSILHHQTTVTQVS